MSGTCKGPQRCFSRECGGFWHRVADHETKRGNNNRRCGQAGDDVTDDVPLRENAPNEGTRSLTRPTVLLRLRIAREQGETNI